MPQNEQHHFNKVFSEFDASIRRTFEATGEAVVDVPPLNQPHQRRSYEANMPAFMAPERTPPRITLPE